MSVKPYTEKEQYIAEELVEKPLNFISKIGWNQEPPRIHGRMSHSSVGMCLKRLIMQVSGNAPDLNDPESDRVLELGTDIHRRMDDAQWRYQSVLGGTRVVINAFRTETFGDELADSITGTPDTIILDWTYEKPTMWLLDYKTAKDDSFDKTKGNSKWGGAKETHKMQVAGYSNSEEVRSLAKRLGMQVVPAIVYLKKSNLKPFVQVVGPSWKKKALEYWERADAAKTFFDMTGELPAEEACPEEFYQCRYCSMWPGLEDKIWDTKKEENEARAALGERNLALCRQCRTPADMREQLLEMASMEDLEWMMPIP